MAIEVKFRGYVNEVLDYDWGTVYRVSHNQVRRTPEGTFETTGRDYFSIVVPHEQGKVLTRFAKDVQVDVVGKMKTKLYDKKDGSGKGVSLEVRAESMTLANIDQPAADPVLATWPAVKEIPNSNAPF
jgi:single-stranded DNA-binding protein